MTEHDQRLTMWIAAAVGLVAAMAGTVSGLAIALHGHEVPCSDPSAEGPCSVYPRLGTGLAVTFVSLAVGALVVLAFVVLQALTTMRAEDALRRSRVGNAPTTDA